MILRQFPTRQDDAPGNMALDWLLLEKRPVLEEACFRSYGWLRPAATFGYGQVWEAVRAQAGVAFAELVRRPTGGGFVDHREDWTYSLVVPAGHPWHRPPGTTVYQAVHQVLCDVLIGLGQPARLAPPVEKSASPPGSDAASLPAACFAAPEPFDVVAPSGRKIAGAALKRNRRGLLLQGSIWRPNAPGLADWDAFETAFLARLALAIGARQENSGWPEWPPDSEEFLRQQLASEEWNQRR